MSDKAQFGDNQGHTDSTQPKPVRSVSSQSVTDAVVADMHARRETGTKKYGIELLSFNGRDALLEAYQESLDLTMYLKQALMERDANGETKGSTTSEAHSA